MNDRYSAEQFDNTLIWRLLFMFCSIALILTASDALAATPKDDPIGTVFCNLVKVFRGNTARGIAIVGVVVLGIQTLRGQLKWEVALVIVTGIIILFKAPDIIDMVAGDASTASKCGISSLPTS
ncbi:TrbC/VirB2 family protein [Candidatus Tisiphia endosymbiont of Beris chalybata]|uniref:TrbC/VirB2 family protein n=1 Tax=Candidatus Tisiphia endosymbiont of Beris chalybata TaxID=3066262 RepID=UPI00312C9FCC